MDVVSGPMRSGFALQSPLNLCTIKESAGLWKSSQMTCNESNGNDITTEGHCKRKSSISKIEHECDYGIIITAVTTDIIHQWGQYESAGKTTRAK
jgi:hypothetical protein